MAKAWVEQTAAGRFRPRFRTTGSTRKISGPVFDGEWEAVLWIERNVTLPQTSPGAAPAAALPVAPAAPTLGAYADAYLERRRPLLAAQTWNKYAAGVSRFATLRPRPMDEIGVEDVELWLGRLLADQVGRPSINISLMVLGMLYKAARRYGDPTVGVRRLREDLDVAVILDRAHDDRLLAACVDEGSVRRAHRGGGGEGIRALATRVGLSTGTCSTVLNGRPGVAPATAARVRAAAAEMGYEHHANRGPDVHLAAMVLLGLDCGLRWEEAAGLPADAWRGDFLTIYQAVDRQRRIVPPKGGRERRVPVVTPRVVAALTPLVEQARERGGRALVFPSETGRPLDYSEARRRFDGAVRRAGLDPAPTFHDTRHTYGTRLGDAGVPTHEIQKLMGHADERTTERYVHAGTDGRRRDLVLAALGLAA